MSGFIEQKDTPNPHAFVQWQGTDVCMDFHCKCGAHCHFDGFFAYVVECPHCHEQWEMPCNLYPRKVCDQTFGSTDGRVDNDRAKTMEPDEDIINQGR